MINFAYDSDIMGTPFSWTSNGGVSTYTRTVMNSVLTRRFWMGGVRDSGGEESAVFGSKSFPVTVTWAPGPTPLISVETEAINWDWVPALQAARLISRNIAAKMEPGCQKSRILLKAFIRFENPLINKLPYTFSWKWVMRLTTNHRCLCRFIRLIVNKSDQVCIHAIIV